MTTGEKKQAQQVQVTRKLLNTPAINDSEKKTYQIIYRAGELPPHFLFIDEKEWSAEKEKQMIKEDMQKRITTPQETITI